MIASFYIASLRWRSPKLIIPDKQEAITKLSAFVSVELSLSYRNVIVTQIAIVTKRVHRN